MRVSHAQLLRRIRLLLHPQLNLPYPHSRIQAMYQATYNSGCQNCLEYAKRTTNQLHDSPVINGYILQSPVSDREVASLFMSPEDLQPSIRAAKYMIENGQMNKVMSTKLIPPVFATPVTAYRWFSLAAKGYVVSYLVKSLPSFSFSTINTLLRLER